MAKDIYIKGTDSDWYEDATFRIKDGYIGSTPKNLSLFADELIGKHMKLKGYTEYRQTMPTISKNIYNKKVTDTKNSYDKIESFCYISLAILAILLIFCLIA
ncbi:MAG: hypothetical protein BEN19_04020 [Epulopiscium sp. Nuni2H_MBin003]|nr:MAG: hypothetical protein BEN19_04020 [Epulopiscium sp. Nuni2H_MBin003]